MGKKKAVKKTKELSVAIAESSSLDAEGQLQQQQQVLTPRKRGRPRKVIVEKTQVEQVKEEETAAAPEGHDDIEEIHSKKVKIYTADEEKEEEEEGEEEGQSSKMKEEATTTTITSSKRQLPTRSRARRKSKPRKSS